jgi:hypothetical protein
MPSGPLREVGAGGTWRETSGNPGHPKANHPSIKQMAKDSPRIRGTTPQIQQAARHLRQNLTPAEAKLWSVLQKRQQNGLKYLTTALTLIKTAIKTLSPPEYALRAAARGGG